MDNWKQNNAGIYIPKNEILHPVGAVELVARDAITKHVVDIVKVKNLFVTVGKAGLADLFRGNTAGNRGQPTYQAIGTSSTAPAAGDTQLTAEGFRKLISIRSASANVASFQTFFDTSEGNIVIAEAGLFGDNATGTANSGVLYCHALLSFTKTSSVTLTITWTVTF
jgi:hypothetical protein